MTTPIDTLDFSGIMPMQWVLAVDPAKLNTSQVLSIKYGQRSVDSSPDITVEPGVYMFTWDTNLPDGEWNSFYFRDHSNSSTTFTNFGSREPGGTRRVIIPKKSKLRCYAAIESEINIVEPVVSVTLIPVAPLANVFET